MTTHAIPLGLCMCGCGQRTAIATKTKTRDGWVKGRPYRYIRYHNLPKGRPKRSFTAEQRRESDAAYILARVGKDAVTGCWLWTASVSARHGYPKFCNLGRKTTGHRVSYEAFVGPIPSGMLVCHKCDTPRCVNPDHLFLGSSKDNTQDMLMKGRRPTRRGALHPLARVTESQVREIRAATGTMKEIGARFGLSGNHVGQIKRGLRWAHVS